MTKPTLMAQLVELQDWIDLYHQNPANIDASIDSARKEQK